MTRILLSTAILLMAGSLAAQDKLSSLRVYSDPPGAPFYVDGKQYDGSATFLWAVGSKHVLSVNTPVTTPNGARYTFSSWTDSTGLMSYTSPTLPITVDPGITWIKLTVVVEYSITLQMTECGSADPMFCQSPGAVIISGQSFNTSAVVWLAVGSTVVLQAVPATGWLFLGWGLQDAINGTSEAFLSKFVLTKPIILQPRFEVARRITFQTSPPELQVLVDRQAHYTPITLDMAADSKHVIGAPSPQDDRLGKTWVFDSWEHGGGQNTVYIPAGNKMVDTLTARFVPGMNVTFRTNPTGLKLNIDGRDNWQAYTFTWGVGSKHQFSAASEQVDASGRKYVFKGWNNGGPAAQEIVVEQDTPGNSLKLVAEYELLGRLTVSTTPGGVAVQVDGVDCKTPCTLDRAAGDQVRLGAPAVVPLGEGSRMEFEAWSDGQRGDRVVRFTTAVQTLTASYKTLHRLSASVDPDASATVLAEPGSADSYYPADTRVVLTAEPKAGFKFRGWMGDVSGPFRQVSLLLKGPSAVRALFDRVPFLAADAVRNAAGGTPDATVAPGSIVSIFGMHLAASYETGPALPLAQTIGRVTVHIADRLLPLFFVSPEQINAQLPFGLEEGLHRLTVRWEGNPEVNTEVRVARNAPGLFLRDAEAQAVGLAVRQDGRQVTLETPALLGQTVTLYGTGFGPQAFYVPEGFAAPENPACPLADKLELWIGDRKVEPEFSGAAPGLVGMQIVRVRLPEDLPTGIQQYKVLVNGKESNPAPLPVAPQ